MNKVWMFVRKLTFFGPGITGDEITNFDTTMATLPLVVQNKLYNLAEFGDEVEQAGFLGFIESALIFHNITKKQYGFLRHAGSMVCSNPYWKEMVMAKEIKEKREATELPTLRVPR